MIAMEVKTGTARVVIMKGEAKLMIALWPWTS
jgi:hypothetical protein